MLVSVRSPRRLEGGVRPPGDKSISHRALMLNAVSDGAARVSGLGSGADVSSTASCLRQLGVDIEGEVIQGRGLEGLREPDGPLDCGNSGTTMRFLAGLLSSRPFMVTLVGDDSLSRRPMDRVAEPLRRMGARVETNPLRVGGGGLKGIEHVPAVPSAQVKSCLLLAGLYAEGTTTVREAVPTRDHTELMLAAMGAPVRIEPGLVAIDRAERLRPLDIVVPADFSGAAFWLVAGSLHPQANLVVEGVGLNPSRAGMLDVLENAGVSVNHRAARLEGQERVADLEVGTAQGPLRPLELGAREAAMAIDELPVIAVAATQLPGTSSIRGAAELRVKETDRIAAMAAGLRAMGVDLEELPDGMVIRGPARLTGARVRSEGDHRVAMALAVAGLLADGITEIDGAECVDISYPGFWDHLARLGGVS